MVWFADEAETQRSAATVTCQWQLELEVQVLTVPSSHAARSRFPDSVRLVTVTQPEHTGSPQSEALMSQSERHGHSNSSYHD